MSLIRRLIILLSSLGALALLVGGIASEALHAARLRTVATQFEVKLPSYPGVAKPGDIVLVTGTMEGDALDLGYGNPSFPGAFMVSRLLEYDKGVIRRKWRTVESNRWVSPNGRLGSWTLSRSIMEAALDGSRAAVPQREFVAPRRIKGEAVEPAKLTTNGDVLEFNARGRHYRLGYKVWPGNRPYTVLAQVADTHGLLMPFRVPGLQGAPFSAMAIGAHPDPSFLLELSQRDYVRNLGFLLLAMLCGAIAWFVVLRWIWEDEGFVETLVPAAWRGAATAAPIALVAFWPAAGSAYVWITAISIGGAAGVLFLLLGLLLARWMA